MSADWRGLGGLEKVNLDYVTGRTCESDVGDMDCWLGEVVIYWYKQQYLRQEHQHRRGSFQHWAPLAAPCTTHTVNAPTTMPAQCSGTDSLEGEAPLTVSLGNHCGAVGVQYADKNPLKVPSTSSFKLVQDNPEREREREIDDDI